MFFFFKQKTAYEMRISDWSSDVCSSDLVDFVGRWSVRLELLHGLACGLGAEKGFAVADRHRANRRAQLRHGLNRIAGFLTLWGHEGKDHGKGAVELAHNVERVRHAHGVEYGSLGRDTDRKSRRLNSSHYC